MTEPKVEEKPGLIRLIWESEMIVISVTRAREHTSDGRITGEIAIDSTAPEASGHIHEAQFNFSSTATRDKLAKTLAGRAPDVSWEDIISQLCYRIVRIVRRGEPVIWIDVDAEIKPPQYLVYPLIPLKEHTVIFGEGGSWKSGLASTLLFIAMGKWQNEPLGMLEPAEPHIALYLDWESNEETFHWNLQRIKNGMGLPAGIKVAYRRCWSPLADDVEQIHNKIIEVGADIIFIDSIGGATAADLNATEPAIKFFNAIRKFNTTNICLAHTAKNTGDNQKTVYGNVYYQNLPRSIWELKNTQDVDEDTIEIALFHRKHNISRKFSPIGFKVNFTETDIKIEQSNPTDSFLKNMSLATRIIEQLKDDKKLNLEQLIKILEEKPQSIRRTLYRLKDNKRIVLLPDKKTWGLFSDQQL